MISRGKLRENLQLPWGVQDASVNSLSDGAARALDNRVRLRADPCFRPACCFQSRAQRSCTRNDGQRGLPQLRCQLEMNATVDVYRHASFPARSHGSLPAVLSLLRQRHALSLEPFGLTAPGTDMARFISDRFPFPLPASWLLRFVLRVSARMPALPCTRAA
jgi:hypothetical protein